MAFARLLAISSLIILVIVYLTNTLEEPVNAGQTGTQASFSLITDSLALEAKGADDIKANTPITVVIGNPPYSKSTTKSNWVTKLVQVYREGLLEKKSDTQREEWKFIRYAFHMLTNSKFGVLGYIVNNSFLDAPTLRLMRRHMLLNSDFLKIINLHGDSNK